MFSHIFWCEHSNTHKKLISKRRLSWRRAACFSIIHHPDVKSHYLAVVFIIWKEAKNLKINSHTWLDVISTSWCMCGQTLEFVFLLLGLRHFLISSGISIPLLSAVSQTVTKIYSTRSWSCQFTNSRSVSKLLVVWVFAPSAKSELALYKQRASFRIIWSSGMDLWAINKLPSAVPTAHDCKKN